MQPQQLTSGDVLADRRADYAEMLADGGEPRDAAELMQQALELAPLWAAGWFRLATYLEKAGDAAAAVTAFRRVLELDTGDMFGAGLKLAVLGADAMPNHPSSRYVERLFDDYAGRFDRSLVEKLGYSVPVKLAALVPSLTERGHPFTCVIDLGCGTGLFGVEIRARATRLEGYDLSANMLAKAVDKHVYDHLAQADLSLDAGSSGVFPDGLPAHRADLVSAADVLMYLGALDGVFALAAMALSAGGLFAFSVEDAGQQDGFRLGESLRYAHSHVYVADRLAAAGFRIVESLTTVIRMDAGNPVQGILFLAEITASSQHP